MCEQGLCAQLPRHRTVTTKSEKGAPVAANLLQQNFHASCPNQKWTTDTTYIWTQEGWLYLAVVLDLFSRMVARLGDGGQPGCEPGRTGETVGPGSSPSRSEITPPLCSWQYLYFSILSGAAKASWFVGKHESHSQLL